MKPIELTTMEEYQEEYEKARKKYIAEYKEYRKGYRTSWFGWRDGEYEHNPEIGEAKWNDRYPKGLKDWMQGLSVNALHYINTCITINKLIKEVESLKKKLK